MSPTKSPPWRREEIILALELYLRGGRRVPEDHDPEVVALSEDLGRLPLIPLDQRAPNFRNPNGVVLKISNLRAFDPHAVSKGMSAGSKLDKELMETYADDPIGLALEARAIRMEYREWLAPVSTPPTPLRTEFPRHAAAEPQAPWDTSFDRYARHLMLEQNMEAQESRRESARSLACEICGFDFGRTYGEVGHGYIQYHHRVPLADLTNTAKPTAADLTLICANCHAMLHQADRVLTVDELKSVLRENQRSAIRSLNERLNPGSPSPSDDSR